MPTTITLESRKRRWLPWVGGGIGLIAIAWVLQDLDIDRFQATLHAADLRVLLLVPLAVMAEQFVRAWKWRQLLMPLRPIATLPLFAAIMAGYLLAILVPFGFGTVARSWLVARRENLAFSGILATVTLDRLTDGIVFAALVPIALLMVAFPDPTGDIRTGLTWAGAGSLVLFFVLCTTLAGYRLDMLRPGGRIVQLVERLPPGLAGATKNVATAFAEGIAWPGGWRGAGIMAAALLIKLLAAADFLWGGLAFGVVLPPSHYIFLLVFLGFLIILGHFARVAGSFVIGAIFALAGR